MSGKCLSFPVCVISGSGRDAPSLQQSPVRKGLLSSGQAHIPDMFMAGRLINLVLVFNPAGPRTLCHHPVHTGSEWVSCS